MLADAIDENDTAYTAEGPEQPDEDDYGYTSKEASSLYRSIMDKYQALPPEKKFSDAKKKERSTSELITTKDRVREAILREREEAAMGRKRSLPNMPASRSDDPNGVVRHRSRKNLYDPEAERAEEERRKREEEEERRRIRAQKRPPPPVMDFQKLLELASKKQHEPVEIMPPPAKKVKEPERLLTRKEKLEIEERKAYLADRERRKQEALNPSKARRPDEQSNEPSKPVNKMLPNGRIPKLNSSNSSQIRPATSTTAPPADAKSRSSEVPGRTSSNSKSYSHQTNGSSAGRSSSGISSATSKPSLPTKYDDRRLHGSSGNSSNSSSMASSSMKKSQHSLSQKTASNVPPNGIKTSSSSSSSSYNGAAKLATSSSAAPSASSQHHRQSSSSSSSMANAAKSKLPSRDANRNEIKSSKTDKYDRRDTPTQSSSSSSKDLAKSRLPASSKDVKTRDFPPKDLFKSRDSKDVKTREFPPKDIRTSAPQKTREFPPKDLVKTREFPPKDIKTREFPPRDLVKTREFPPKDLVKTREFPPKDLIKTREFPPKDLKTREFPPRDVQRRPQSANRKSSAHKRRILDDDDDEYDSEMDDFIDDDDGNDDYSKYIKEIFGYDKSRYRHLDEDIDNMESTFAQQMREEQISRKIGLMEDLEDMRLEAEEMKRKAHRKKRRVVSDDESD